MTKEQIGEVWQLRHDVSYRVRITRRQSLKAAVTLVGQRRIRDLVGWKFRCSVEDGAFAGTMELAAQVDVVATRGEILSPPYEEQRYLDYYYSFYDGDEKAARASTDVYRPKAHLVFRPTPALEDEIPRLAAEVAP